VRGSCYTHTLSRYADTGSSASVVLASAESGAVVSVSAVNPDVAASIADRGPDGVSTDLAFVRDWDIPLAVCDFVLSCSVAVQLDKLIRREIGGEGCRHICHH
jgi:hypothetical protein